MESGDPIGWVLAFRTSVIHLSYVCSGVPHLLTNDDVYNGYHIFRMRRSMMHDPDVFSNPAEFRPEQFFDNEPAIAVVALWHLDREEGVYFFSCSITARVRRLQSFSWSIRLAQSGMYVSAAK